MSLEQNKDIAHRCFGAINKQDVASMAEVMSPKWAAEVASWFPNVNEIWAGHRIEVVDLLAEDDKVWCRLRTNGLNSGMWQGLPPTGEPWTNTGIWFLRIAEGKVIEIEWLFDELNLVKQFGGKIIPIAPARDHAINE